MTKTLKLAFDLGNNKSFTVKLLDPRADLTKADACTVMQECIDKKIFLVKGAQPVGIKSTVVNTTEEIELA